MRSIGIALSLALGLTVLMTSAAANGQEAEVTGSPPPAAPAAFELAPGVTAEPLAFIAGSQVPAVYRLRLEAGATYDFAPDPSIALAVVETGAIGLTVPGALTIHRAGDAGSAGEPSDAGSTVTVGTGDHLIVPANTPGRLQNDGSEAASVLVASLPSPGPIPATTPGASPATDSEG